MGIQEFEKTNTSISLSVNEIEDIAGKISDKFKFLCRKPKLTFLNGKF